MLVQENRPTDVHGHHGNCFTYPRDPDGHAPEAAHLPTRHWEVQQLDSNRGGDIGIQRTRGKRSAHVSVEVIPSGR